MRGLLVISSLLFMLPGYRSLSQDMVVNVEREYAPFLLHIGCGCAIRGGKGWCLM